jgi:hypothetical protein
VQLEIFSHRPERGGRARRQIRESAALGLDPSRQLTGMGGIKGRENVTGSPVASGSRAAHTG